MPSEPRVRTVDVRDCLLRAIRPEAEIDGDSVALLAERAGKSTRTVYRVLSARGAATISLDLADRLLVAADAHISECELVWGLEATSEEAEEEHQDHDRGDDFDEGQQDIHAPQSSAAVD